MTYAICIDSDQPIERFEPETRLSEAERQTIARDFYQRHDIGPRGVAVRPLARTQPIIMSGGAAS